MKGIIVVLIALFPGFAFSQDFSTGCSKFREGKFEYNDSSGKVIVTRTKKRQIEENVKTGKLTTLRIRWTGDCEYELKQISTSHKNQDRANGSVTRVVITRVFPDGYEYVCGCKNSEDREASRGTMSIIKEPASIEL